ncbi:MAG: reverse transcriptase-like protein [Endomicrobium sp.]|jgi:ribonuclease HI|nr:reverse transcriptase-like protein [Endomicrobium sp.]
MIYAYTDSGIKNGLAVATTLFITDSYYLDMITGEYEHVKSLTEGELLGIWQAINHAVSKWDVQDLIVYSDAKVLVTQFNRFNSSKMSNMNVKYYDIWKLILELIKGRNITCKYIEAHQNEHNPNKFCDITSSVLLSLHERDFNEKFQS